ncbi:hypothetical protein D3C75_746610 [compost metagenome]
MDDIVARPGANKVGALRTKQRVVTAFRAIDGVEQLCNPGGRTAGNGLQGIATIGVTRQHANLQADQRRTENQTGRGGAG